MILPVGRFCIIPTRIRYVSFFLFVFFFTSPFRNRHLEKRAVTMTVVIFNACMATARRRTTTLYYLTAANSFGRRRSRGIYAVELRDVPATGINEFHKLLLISHCHSLRSLRRTISTISNRQLKRPGVFSLSDDNDTRTRMISRERSVIRNRRRSTTTQWRQYDLYILSGTLLSRRCRPGHDLYRSTNDESQSQSENPVAKNCITCAAKYPQQLGLTI